MCVVYDNIIMSSSSSSSMENIVPTASGCLEEGLADDDSWVIEEDDYDDHDLPVEQTNNQQDDDDNSDFFGIYDDDHYYDDDDDEEETMNRNSMDFTLYTIIEESCEESSDTEAKRWQQTPTTTASTQLQNYFVVNISGTDHHHYDHDEGEIPIPDDHSVSEESADDSIVIQLTRSGNNYENRNDDNDLASTSSSSSRLEKYFLSGFMGYSERGDGDFENNHTSLPIEYNKRKKLSRVAKNESESRPPNDDTSELSLSSEEHKIDNEILVGASPAGDNHDADDKELVTCLNIIPTEDEEANHMMSKMRSLFKSLIINQNTEQRHYWKSALEDDSFIQERPLSQFEYEISRLMKTVPGIRQQLVEYLSSEDTCSDSSDYTTTSSDISENIMEVLEEGKDESVGTAASCGRGVDVQNELMRHISSKLVSLMREISPDASESGEVADSSIGIDFLNDDLSLLHRSVSHDALLEETRQDAVGSDNERFSWRGSFESTLMMATASGSRSRLSSTGEKIAAAKRYSAGDLLSVVDNTATRNTKRLDRRVQSCTVLGGDGGHFLNNNYNDDDDRIWKSRSSLSPSPPRSNATSTTTTIVDISGCYDHLDKFITLPRACHLANKSSVNVTGSLPRLGSLGSFGSLGGQLSGLLDAHNDAAAVGSSNSIFINNGGIESRGNNAAIRSARYRPPGYGVANSTGGKLGNILEKFHSETDDTKVVDLKRLSGRAQHHSSIVQSHSPCIPGRIITDCPNNDDDVVTTINVVSACGMSSFGAASPTITTNELSNSKLHSTSISNHRMIEDTMIADSSSCSTSSSHNTLKRSIGNGEVQFGLQYNYKTGTIEINIKQCRNLAAVHSKHNTSDPYIKVYLLPDKSKNGKRKTRTKKHTLNPIFDEILKYNLTLKELESRILWLSVWHLDVFGRNIFLGEITMPLGNQIFDNPDAKWYSLQERAVLKFPECLQLQSKAAELTIALKYVPPSTIASSFNKKHSSKKTVYNNRLTTNSIINNNNNNQNNDINYDINNRTSQSGSLFVLVKQAKNLLAVKSNGTSDPFCKCCLVGVGRNTKVGIGGIRKLKQKTAVAKHTCNPIWNHTFVYDGINAVDRPQLNLILSIWHNDRLASNVFLGAAAVQLSSGAGNDDDLLESDSNESNEYTLWQRIFKHPNFWIESCLTLNSFASCSADL